MQIQFLLLRMRLSHFWNFQLRESHRAAIMFASVLVGMLFLIWV